jgi:hypothetical protein
VDDALRRCTVKKSPKKMKLTRESLRCLTASPADPALKEAAGAAATLPPVCEHTNYISCLRC